MDELISAAVCSDADCKAKQGLKLSVPACLPVRSHSVALFYPSICFVSLSVCLSFFLLSSSLKRACGRGSRISNARSCARVGCYVNLPLMYTHSNTRAHTNR